MEFNPDLEPDVLTDKDETKEIPCRKCGRRCVVTRFASPLKTECSHCRRGQTVVTDRSSSIAIDPEPEVDREEPLLFNDELEPEIMTDKDETKLVPCRGCRRPCAVTMFMAPSKVECSTCRGDKKKVKHEQHLRKLAPTTDPRTLENLSDGLINPVFKTIPLCPFDPEHQVDLKAVVHSDNYGPRKFIGWNKNMPKYDQEVGEAVTYQCTECMCVISFSTQHPLPLLAQNAPNHIHKRGVGILESMLGIDPDLVEEAA